MQVQNLIAELERLRQTAGLVQMAHTLVLVLTHVCALSYLVWCRYRARKVEAAPPKPGAGGWNKSGPLRGFGVRQVVQTLLILVVGYWLTAGLGYVHHRIVLQALELTLRIEHSSASHVETRSMGN